MINKIFSQLNEVIKVMIRNNYTHGNLKPENILIKYTDSEKINFDIKLILQSNEKKFSFFNSSINYESPQIKTNNNNNKCDLWSLGVLLYELCINKNIFYSENEKEREDKRIKGIINETDNNKLIRKLTQVDINKKIEWEEYFNDEFFKNNNIIKVNNKQVKITKLKIPLLQIIFSFITEIKKLKIINFNKNLQNKLEVNIKDYVQICKRFKIGEIYGKGNEYDDNGKLIFEGEYLNGVRNGKGKEYDSDGVLLFIGEYLNGERNEVA